MSGRRSSTTSISSERVDIFVLIHAGVEESPKRTVCRTVAPPDCDGAGAGFAQQLSQLIDQKRGHNRKARVAALECRSCSEEMVDFREVREWTRAVPAKKLGLLKQDRLCKRPA